MHAEPLPRDLSDDLTLDLNLDTLDPLPGRARAPRLAAVADAPAAAPAGGSALSLPVLLRGAGALVVIAAFLLYLFQGWRGGDDLTRGLLLLANTGLLTIAGFALGHWVHEAKGARLFIALALAAVPVNFAFLGGITYAHLTWDALAPLDAAIAPWVPAAQGLAAGTAFALAGGSVLLLGLAVWLGFLVMARRSALPLTALYLLANAALLVPARAEAATALLLLGVGLVLATAVVGLRRRDASLATFEGRYALAVLALPLAVMVGRSLWIYSPEVPFFTALSVLGYIGLRQLRAAEPAPARHALVEGGAVLMALLTGLGVVVLAADLDGLRDVVAIPIGAAVLVALLLDLSRITNGRYRGAAAIVAALAMLVNQVGFGGAANAIATLAVGLGVLGYGYAARRSGVFATGALTALAGLGWSLIAVFERFTLGGWTALVLLGVAIIVAGSLVERYGTRIGASITRWRGHFAGRD